MSFGNWYHGEIDGFTERNPMHDFNNRFFTDWDEKQWNLFLNFAMQCLQFYLSTNEKIGAPEGNIRKRNLLAEIGVVFFEWAEDYFKDENINQAVCRREMLDNLKNSHSSMRQNSPTSFKQLHCSVLLEPCGSPFLYSRKSHSGGRPADSFLLYPLLHYISYTARI